ncbi:hypothetical protein R5W24_001739 [Gemmata sp. JC717]|uniref:hypothetical protein n=1 Tax=Gemmata algarum TaxID=2975278 RepID=UPI0021BAF30B|nr:hypothetical protein [Gemmata algarum]MDY3552653.1 hypothetical protein [Gemmata algarum]
MPHSLAINEYDEGNRLRGTVVPNPTWELFLDVFRATQSRTRRLAGISVAAVNGSSLMIDGSGGLFIVLYERFDGFQFQPLPDPYQSNADVMVVCGGVFTTLPRSYLLDEQRLLRVVEDFWYDRLDTTVGWEAL